MAPDEPPRADVLSRLGELLGLGSAESGARLLGASLDALQRYSRAQLLEWARRLGLTDISRLTKAGLARRFREALHALGAAPAPDEHVRAEGEPADVARRFELGPAGEVERRPAHIPWGYGQDRVTAMMIDPDRLYVYWEVTDEAIARTRPRLGPAGGDAWLALRIYDVTGRLFDGTNAHAYFDQQVERTDRQWFFDIGKPSSTACVELGLKSREGSFVRVVRSGRVDFPRREPAPSGEVEWLTVRTASGAIGEPVASGRSAASSPAAASASVEPLGLWPVLHGGMAGEGMAPEVETFHSESTDGARTLAWQGPVVRTAWEAGPFVYPVESPVYVEERRGGTVTVARYDGWTRVVYGPWEVVIHGLDGHAERRVLATWQLACSWATQREVVTRLAARSAETSGASEQRFAAGSEVRLGGASELYRIGASEIRYLGATEVLYAGASERRLRGASEWRLMGASERAYGGASERRFAGASENRLDYPGEADLDPPPRR